MKSIVFNILCACGVGFMIAGALGGSLLIASVGVALTVLSGLSLAVLNV